MIVKTYRKKDSCTICAGCCMYTSQLVGLNLSLPGAQLQDGLEHRGEGKESLLNSKIAFEHVARYCSFSSFVERSVCCA